MVYHQHLLFFWPFDSSHSNWGEIIAHCFRLIINDVKEKTVYTLYSRMNIELLNWLKPP
jgi:hypothetical protein